MEEYCLKLKGVIEIMRIVNCIMIGFAVIIGEFFALKGWPRISDVVLGFLTGFFLQAAADVINDYFDREIDAINSPDRPIPRGDITPREAIFLFIIFTLIGLALPLPLGLESFIFASLFWALSFIYNAKLKATGLPGNIIVSMCVAAPFLFGGLVSTKSFPSILLIFSLLAFLANTGREINKGIVDIEGDKTKNIKTIAISLGPKAAAWIAAIFYLSAVVLSPLPYILNLLGISYLILIVSVTDVLFTIFAVSLLRDHSPKNAKKIKNLVLIAMLTALIIFMISPFLEF